MILGECTHCGCKIRMNEWSKNWMHVFADMPEEQVAQEVIKLEAAPPHVAYPVQGSVYGIKQFEDSGIQIDMEES